MEVKYYGGFMKSIEVKMKKIQSSNIESIGYNSGKLFIRFKGNTVYKYDNVSRETNDILMESDSKGKFIHNNIKGVFVSTKINLAENKDYEFVEKE